MVACSRNNFGSFRVYNKLRYCCFCCEFSRKQFNGERTCKRGYVRLCAQLAAITERFYNRHANYPTTIFPFLFLYYQTNLSKSSSRPTKLALTSSITHYSDFRFQILQMHCKFTVRMHYTSGAKPFWIHDLLIYLL